MNQAFDTFFQFNKCTIIGHHNNFTFHNITNLKFLIK